MGRKVHRTEWRAVALDMSIESSEMQVLRRGRFQVRPIARVIFRTEGGTVFSGPRISKALQKELEQRAASEPWLPLQKGRKR